MTKQLSPIFDLRELKNAFVGHCKELKCKDDYIKVCKQKFDIIETALKNYEIRKQQYDFIVNVSQRYEELLHLVCKKEVDMFAFKKAENVEIYNKNCNSRYTLTKEQFDLLKEVIKEYE